MAMKRLKASAKAIIFLFCFLAGCDQTGDSSSSKSFAGVPTERTKLIADLESYQTVEQVRKKFGPLWNSSQIIENSSLSPGDKRPAFNIYSVLIKGYSDLNQSGELKLVFFNDRLMKALFFPSDYEAYVELLKQKKGINFARMELELNEARIPPYTRVWLNEWEKEKKFVGWVDIRLSAENRAWIMKYS